MTRQILIHDDYRDVFYTVLLYQVIEADPVRVMVYLETLCPDSINFVVNQLVPARDCLTDIMAVNITAYGFALVSLRRSWRWLVQVLFLFVCCCCFFCDGFVWFQLGSFSVYLSVSMLINQSYKYLPVVYSSTYLFLYQYRYQSLCI